MSPDSHESGLQLQAVFSVSKSEFSDDVLSFSKLPLCHEQEVNT